MISKKVNFVVHLIADYQFVLTVKSKKGNYSYFSDASAVNGTICCDHDVGVATNVSISHNNLDGMRTSIERDILGYTMAAITGISLTFDILIIRHFDYVRENQHSVLFWTFLFSSLISLVLSCVFESPVLPNSTENYLYVLGHSVSSTAQWPLYFLAATYITGNTINIILSASSIFLLVSQYTILKHINPGHRNWIEISGVLSVIAANMLSSIIEIFQKK